jgi:hypothetical protein
MATEKKLSVANVFFFCQKSGFWNFYKGKWLVFADADDFFTPCFSEALDKYKDDENDIIYLQLPCIKYPS